VNALYFLLVAEAFVFGLMWHNQSPRSEGEHEAERPDPALLFPGRSSNFQKQAPPVEVDSTFQTTCRNEL
jgi:hypothetical protein